MSPVDSRNPIQRTSIPLLFTTRRGHCWPLHSLGRSSVPEATGRWKL